MELLGSYPTAALAFLPFTFIQSWDPGTPWITVSKQSGVPRGRVRKGGQRLLRWQLLPHSFSFQKNVYLFCYLGSACLWTWQMLCQIGSLISVHVDYNFCQPEKLCWASSDEELRFATVVPSLWGTQLLARPQSTQEEENKQQSEKTRLSSWRGFYPGLWSWTMQSSLESLAWFTMPDCWNASLLKECKG